MRCQTKLGSHLKWWRLLWESQWNGHTNWDFPFSGRLGEGVGNEGKNNMKQPTKYSNSCKQQQQRRRQNHHHHWKIWLFNGNFTFQECIKLKRYRAKTHTHNTIWEEAIFWLLLTTKFLKRAQLVRTLFTRTQKPHTYKQIHTQNVNNENLFRSESFREVKVVFTKEIHTKQKLIGMGWDGIEWNENEKDKAMARWYKVKKINVYIYAFCTSHL